MLKSSPGLAVLCSIASWLALDPGANLFNMNASHLAASPLPPNSLRIAPTESRRRQPAPLRAIRTAIDESSFYRLIDGVTAYYLADIKAMGAKLTVNRNWRANGVNANATRTENRWYINIYGGLARHPQQSLDGFILAVCHEFGHHLGGFPFKLYTYTWAANEGQADYFATQACVKGIWRNETMINELFDLPGATEPAARQKCDQAYQADDDRFLCYRISAAAKAFTAVLSTLHKSASPPSAATPDSGNVGSTLDSYPSDQCRMDTFIAGALCEMEFDTTAVPASEDAQRAQSCFRSSGYFWGYRPPCWFRARL